MKSGGRRQQIEWGGLPEGATVLVDTAPWIYLLQDHPVFAPRFEGLFAAAEAGRVELALSTVTLAEILTGPYKAGELALAKRYEKALTRLCPSQLRYRFRRHRSGRSTHSNYRTRYR